MDPDSPKPRQLRPPENSDEQLQAASAAAERQERVEYLRSLQPQHKPKASWPKWAVLGLLIVLLAGGAYYWFVLHKPAAKPAVLQKQTAQSTGIDNQSTQPIKTKHYDSSNFSLSFDYPDTWTVTDDGSGKLTAKSPAVQLKDTTGKAMAMQILLTIQGPQTSLDAFKTGNATAVIDSEKIAYTKPTPTQRAQTYLSFLNYASTTATGIDGIYVTGDFGYQKAQAIPLVDVAKADPLITITFLKCATDSCSGTPTPATISAANWSDVTYLDKAIKTTLTSLAVQ